MFSWVVEIWSPMREAGIEKYEYIDWFRDHPIDDDLKLYRWSRDKLGGVAHVAWKPFDHPQLGKIEIGGWNRFHAFSNPPPQFLERELARFPKWMLWQALTSPKLELVAAECDALGDDSLRVRLVVQNTGWLPSYVSKRALERKVVRGVDRRDRAARGREAACTASGARIWASSKARRTSTRASRSGPTTTSPTIALKVEWVVRGEAGRAASSSWRGTRRPASCARA